MTRVSRHLVMLLSALVLILTATSPFGPLPAISGADGIRDSFNPPSSRSTKPKAKKAKVSKFKIYAQTIEDTYRTQGMGYYFSSKTRMRRLLSRLYDEHKAGQKHMIRMLNRIQTNGLGLKDSKRLKPGWAFSIKTVSESYNAYKDGKLSKAEYEAKAKKWLKFVP